MHPICTMLIEFTFTPLCFYLLVLGGLQIGITTISNRNDLKWQRAIKIATNIASTWFKSVEKRVIWADPGALWKKTLRAMRAIRGDALETVSFQPYFWVHRKLPQSTVKLVLASNESYESKTGCNRTLATILWVPLNPWPAGASKTASLNRNVAARHVAFGVHFPKVAMSLSSGGAWRGAPDRVAILKAGKGAFEALKKGPGALGKVKWSCRPLLGVAPWRTLWFLSEILRRGRSRGGVAQNCRNFVRQFCATLLVPHFAHRKGTLKRATTTTSAFISGNSRCHIQNCLFHCGRQKRDNTIAIKMLHQMYV